MIMVGDIVDAHGAEGQPIGEGPGFVLWMAATRA